MGCCNFLFVLFILLIKTSTTHINVQTKPPVEILRCCILRILILIWHFLSVESQHHPIRGLPFWVDTGVGDDGSGGFVSWNSNETSASKYLLSQTEPRRLRWCQRCTLYLRFSLDLVFKGLNLERAFKSTVDVGEEGAEENKYNIFL